VVQLFSDRYAAPPAPMTLPARTQYVCPVPTGRPLSPAPAASWRSSKVCSGSTSSPQRLLQGERAAGHQDVHQHHVWRAWPRNEIKKNTHPKDIAAPLRKRTFLRRRGRR